jgi:subfamily B ATP-binding cassette protein MsbA
MRSYFKLFKLLKQFRGFIVLSLVLSVLESAAAAVAVYLSIPLLKALFESGAAGTPQVAAPGNVFNNIRHNFESFIFSSGDRNDILGKVCLLIIIFYLAKNIFGYLQGILTQYVEKSLVTQIRDRLYRHYNRLSLRFFSRRKAGDIISRMINDVNFLQNGISLIYLNLIKDPVIILFFLVMAFSISMELTVISMLMVPVSLTLILYVGKKLNKYSRRVQEKISDLTSTVSEGIYGSKIIRAFSMEKFENKKFSKQLRDYFRTVMKHSIYNELSRPLTEFISVAVGVFIIWYGGQQVFAGKIMSPEEFLGFLIIIFNLMAPVKDLATINSRIQEASAAAGRVFEVMETKPAIQDEPGSTEKTSFDRQIQLSNVFFRYSENGKWILNNISLTIRKNEKLAIVGLSGVGKSTLVDLMPRFYECTEGKILMDGTDIKSIKLESLRNLFGIVTQEIILFNDTIRNNIAFGQENVPMDKIQDAAINANAHEFIMKTEKGYDTIIGERGIKLSGGQKQRIAIARALLKNAPILIFDEATSSLDTGSERLIQEAIERLIKNKTSIVIAHRLSTIKNADRILVLHEGRIDNVGTHEELISDNQSVYKKLYEMQFS